MPDDLDDILESPEHTLLATDLGNTEGPLWHPEGYLTFVDLVGNRLQRWDQTSGVSVVREDTGEGNGCTLDRQGRLIQNKTPDHYSWGFSYRRKSTDFVPKNVWRECEGVEPTYPARHEA